MNENNVSIGNAGEYFVAGELERRGFTVAVPMSNVKDFDILAISRTTYKQLAIQVKTTNKKDWILDKKNEDLTGDNIFYVFVYLNKLGTPEYHIVPSTYVASTIKRDYQNWISSPGKKGQPHKDIRIRRFFDKDNTYLGRWDLLN